MGSRRSFSFGNGRSSNGVDINGSSRPGGYSYLSNVRPENRSTLCSVMAQLTEETQPSFETTLKSKAVSENCNVKFTCVVTGYPSPQVIWYKDDMQLDRYCGLPKYEIFRNGNNHSLHIYNCTVEDAAIYQASASNSKGIVSCSGVLEVGEMNEFKIHQRYFAKLKQKAENKRREVEGKENQEPVRTISPDRSQRKRRSTMEAFMSTPSSMEDGGNEESHQAVPMESEARLQDTTVDGVEEKPVPISNGAVSALTNGQVISENGGKDGTYIYDSAQKTFTTCQPKTPFVKKKIRISNSSKVAKADTQGERTSEEKRAKEEPSTSVALACTESGQTKGNLVEVMEVESIVSSSVLNSHSRNVAEHHLKSATEEALFVSKDKNVCAVPPQKEHLTASVSLAAHTPTKYTAPGTEGKLAAKCEKEDVRKDTEENLEKWKQNPHTMSTQLQTSAVPAPQPAQKIELITNTDDGTVMDVDVKSNTFTDGTLLNRDLASVDTARESRIALPQHACEQTGDQLSEKETTPCQKNASVPRPVLLSEVTQANAKMNRNDAPVNLELQPDPCSMNAQPPQKTPSERDTATDDIQTPSVHHGLEVAIDKMTQDTWDHSRGSNESCTALFTDLQKSPLESPGGGESTQGCNVSPTNQQSQVDTPIKSVEGTKIQVDEKLEGNEVAKLLMETESVVPNEKIVEMETETAAVCKIEQTEIEKTKGKADKDIDVIVMDESNKERNKNEPISKMEEENSSELHSIKPAKFESDMPQLKKPPENTNLSKHQIKGFQEIQKPVTRVISVAELLRSQIQALDVTVANSIPTILVPAVQNPTTTATDTCQELKDEQRKCKLEVKKSMPDRKSEPSIDDPPPKNIKETLMEIYHQLNHTDQEKIQTPGRISPPIQALQKPLVIPPISVVDTGTTIDTTGHHGSAKKYNEGIMDIGQETGVSTLTDCPVVSLSESENVRNSFTPMTSKEELTQRLISSSNLSGGVSHKPGTPLSVTPVKASSQECKNSTTFSDQCKIEEHNTNSCFQSVQKIPTKSMLSIDTREDNQQPIQQQSSMVEEFSRIDSLTNPNPEASPLLKRRNCVSPIPSATPQELASGARRKILIPKAKPEEATEDAPLIDNQTQKKEASTQSSKLSSSPVMLSTSPSLSQRSPLLQPSGERTSPVEKRSPLLNRRMMTAETQARSQQPTEDIRILKTEKKPAEKGKHDPFKAPQVIRKIRGETFADASGHLNLWCQFFNILSDSTIKWYRNEMEIAQIKRNAGDETQVNLAIVQASSKDSGVYGCTITNEYGTDSTDYLLSADILAGLSLREDLGVGEEIEMTPLVFNKGVADSGVWGNKFFGRIMMQESRIGDGCAHKVWRAKVIYGLEPVFESGNTCIIKVRNPIAYGGKEESCLIDRNLDFVRQECKIQNLAREYCKIFSAEARVIENFGPSLEVIPVYLMYRPANTIPYAIVEADLMGVYQKYSVLDHTGRIEMRTASDVEQKCCALQHWIFQWTNGNLLLTQLEGVDTKITNVGITVKSTGHQGLSIEGNPKVFEQFISQHQCNYFCGLLSLRSLKVLDSLMTPTKPKGSRSPLLQRKIGAGSSSPQTGRKAASSPRLPRKAEQEGSKTITKQKAADAPKVVKTA